MRGTEHRAALALLATILAACGGGQEESAATVARIGASRLVSEVEILKTQAATDLRTTLPESLWPQAIRELSPQAVHVSRKGVFVQRSRRFVEEEGIFIAFPGAAIDVGGGADPSFEPIAPQLYAYRIKG